MTAGAPRREIAVLVSRFPLITETFILREIIELERQGQPVLLVPMIRETPDVIHPEARPWIDRALYSPWLSGSIVAANLRAFLRAPLQYLKTAAELFVGMLRSPDLFVRTVALFPKSVWLAGELSARGVRHVHAHFATHPATMAMVIARFAPEITFSITAHAHDIFVNRVMLGTKLLRAAGVRAISRFNRAYLSALYPRLPLDRIEVIRVGIEPEKYAGDAAREGVFRILAVAALKPYKGIRILIAACRSLRNRGMQFACEVVGDGPLRRPLEAQIARASLGEQVRLAGARPQHEVAAMMRSASVFVLPSIIASDGQMEGIPVALMEAMASRIPVIASAISGIPELVENEVTGLLVDPNNPDLLAAAIRRIHDDRELAARLAEAGRTRVLGEFSLRENVSQLISWLDRMNPPGDPIAIPPLGAAIAIGVRELHSTRDSRVARLMIASAGREPEELVLKEHRSREGESAPPEVRAGREARVLEEIGSHTTSCDGWYLAAPELISTAGASILMRQAKGTRLDQLAKRERGRAHDERLERAIEGAAAWLRWFHSLQERRVHGDFWPGNIFVDEGTITAIDFEGVRAGDPLDDVSYFLVHLELFFPPPYRRRFRDLRTRFLTASFGSNVPHREVALAEAAAARTLRQSLGSRGLRGMVGAWQLAHHRHPEEAA